MKRRQAGFLLLAIVLTAAVLWRIQRADSPARSFPLEGRTMGTTYAVSVGEESPVPAARLQAAIDARLREINASMSTWDPDSEITRINAAPAQTEIPLSNDIEKVLGAALQLSQETGGAFDMTLGPLVNLWGYGPASGDSFPTRAEIENAMGRCGREKLSLGETTLVKQVAGVELDLSGIAKGYGVDEVARILRENGITRYLVEIGGEVAALGRNPRGEPWSVGIERPDEAAPRGASFLARVNLTEGALATSGSYRRFSRKDGRKSHHILDPRTGEPTRSSLVSVTVYAPDCMNADGIATALMVMGVEEGLRYVESREGVEALFLESREEGGYAQSLSSGFERLVD